MAYCSTIFSFYGPNLLDSKRSMMVWETEARAGRQHFKSILATYGPTDCSGGARQYEAAGDKAANWMWSFSRPRKIDLTGRDRGGERSAQFAFLQFPDSPGTTTRRIGAARWQ